MSASPDIEMGRLSSSSRSSDELSLPDEPSRSNWRGRCANTLCPAIASITTIAEGVWAAYEFDQGSTFRAGLLTAFAVATCCVSGAFWRYYFKAEWNAQAQTLAEQLRGQKETELALRDEILEYKETTDRLTAQGVEWEKRATTLEEQQAESSRRENAVLEELQATKGELQKLQLMREHFEASTNHVKQALEHVTLAGTEASQKILVMQSIIGSLDTFPQALKSKVDDLSIDNQGLKKDLERFEMIVKQFKESLLRMTEEYTETKAQRERFKVEVVKLKEERKKIELNLHHQTQIVSQLQDILDKYQEIIPQLKDIKELKELFSKSAKSNKTHEAGQNNEDRKEGGGHRKSRRHKNHSRK